MSPIFLDNDIILDVLAKRHPFYHAAAKLMTLVEKRAIEGCTSSLIFSNLYYILRKLRSREIALNQLRKLRSIVNVLPVDDRAIDFALHSAFTDFEDAIQYHTAKQHPVKYLITRNTTDYKTGDTSQITICTAKDFLTLWESTNNM